MTLARTPKPPGPLPLWAPAPHTGPDPQPSRTPTPDARPSSTKPPASPSSPRPPLLHIQSQFPSTRPRPRPGSIPSWPRPPRLCRRPPPFRLDPGELLRPDLALSAGKPSRAGPREEAGRWRARHSLQVPSGAAAILLCCAGCLGAERAAWAGPAATTPLPCCCGGGASRRQFRRRFWRGKAWGVPAREAWCAAPEGDPVSCGAAREPATCP